MLSASPSSVFQTQSSQYEYRKAYEYSILTVTELRSPRVRVLCWVLTVYATTDSEHKFHKTGIENWLPI